jgi:hypothetical protein
MVYLKGRVFQKNLHIILALTIAIQTHTECISTTTPTKVLHKVCEVQVMGFCIGTQCSDVLKGHHTECVLL